MRFVRLLVRFSEFYFVRFVRFDVYSFIWFSAFHSESLVHLIRSVCLVHFVPSVSLARFVTFMRVPVTVIVSFRCDLVVRPFEFIPVRWTKFIRSSSIVPVHSF